MRIPSQLVELGKIEHISFIVSRELATSYHSDELDLWIQLFNTVLQTTELELSWFLNVFLIIDDENLIDSMSELQTII